METEISNVLTSLRESVEEFRNENRLLTKRFDDYETRQARPGGGLGYSGKALSQQVWESAEFQQLKATGRGRCILRIPDFESKSVLTETGVGSATSGVLMPQRLAGIVEEARRELRMRDLLTVLPCSSNAVDFVQIKSGVTTKASPVTEADTKPENAMEFESVNEPVRTIASWLPASRQILDDMVGLRAVIDSALAFQVLAEEEAQVLFGNGAGQNLHGLTHQAQAFDLTILTASDGYEYSDLIAAGCSQIAADNELLPNFVCLHPTDFWRIRRCKSSTGEYLFGSPNQPMPVNLFGLIAVQSTAMPVGYFLVGNSSAQASAIFERQGLVIDISTEHSDYFVRNLVAIRAEMRAALAVFRPNAFCYGQFVQSPA